MDITASMVKELRQMSGAGMMDCKKALNETNGDMDAAIEFLRKSGIMKAEKKSDRIAAEGLVTCLIDGQNACIVEVNSETDFVARNEVFRDFCGDVAKEILSSDASNVDELMDKAWLGDSSKTVKDALTEKISVIGENLNIRRFEKCNTNGLFVSYIHGEGRIGVLIDANADDNDATRTCLKNVAMQIAAMRPKYVSRDEVSEEYINSEKDILLAQAKQENPDKPDNIIEKMIIGRLNKQLKEICLLDQEYVQDSDLSVKAYIEKVGKEAGCDITINSFVRFETGEGIEKKEEDFAAEVAAQMNN